MASSSAPGPQHLHPTGPLYIPPPPTQSPRYPSLLPPSILTPRTALTTAIANLRRALLASHATYRDLGLRYYSLPLQARLGPPPPRQNTPAYAAAQARVLRRRADVFAVLWEGFEVVPGERRLGFHARVKTVEADFAAVHELLWGYDARGLEAAGEMVRRAEAAKGELDGWLAGLGGKMADAWRFCGGLVRKRELGVETQGEAEERARTMMAWLCTLREVREVMWRFDEGGAEACARIAGGGAARFGAEWQAMMEGRGEEERADW